MGRVPDRLAPDLDLVFVGYNPGRYSAQAGHHFAGASNYFWPLLHDAGLTPRRLTCEEDGDLLQWGIGVTNIVDRMTPSSADLTPEDFRTGAQCLRQKLSAWRPRIVCCLGKDVYRYYAAKRASDPLIWGRQPQSVLPQTIDYLAPNPSRRSVVAYSVRLALMRELQSLVLSLRAVENLQG